MEAAAISPFWHRNGNKAGTDLRMSISTTRVSMTSALTGVTTSAPKANIRWSAIENKEEAAKEAAERQKRRDVYAVSAILAVAPPVSSSGVGAPDSVTIV